MARANRRIGGEAPAEPGGDQQARGNGRNAQRRHYPSGCQHRAGEGRQRHAVVLGEEASHGRDREAQQGDSDHERQRQHDRGIDQRGRNALPDSGLFLEKSGQPLQHGLERRGFFAGPDEGHLVVPGVRGGLPEGLRKGKAFVNPVLQSREKRLVARQFRGTHQDIQGSG